MNKWECEHPGCTSAAVGVGGAVGLRAIGWWFELGPTLFCPVHRPTPILCRDEGDNRGKPCGQCAGEEEANLIQHAIRHHREDMRAWFAAQLLVESKEG